MTFAKVAKAPSLLISTDGLYFEANIACHMETIRSKSEAKQYSVPYSDKDWIASSLRSSSYII